MYQSDRVALSALLLAPTVETIGFYYKVRLRGLAPKLDFESTKVDFVLLADGFNRRRARIGF